MLRRTWALLGGVLLAGTLAVTGFARPDDKPGDKANNKPAAKAPAGTWKVVLPLQTADPWWLVRFESKEGGGWSGKVVAHGEGVPASELTSIAVKDGVLQFAVKAGAARLAFVIRVPAADAPKLKGTVPIRNSIQPVELHRTSLTSLDS